MNKVIRKLKNERVSLKFVDLGDLKQCQVLCFSDASYRNLPDEGSQGDYIIFLWFQFSGGQKTSVVLYRVL